MKEGEGVGAVHRVAKAEFGRWFLVCEANGDIRLNSMTCSSCIRVSATMAFANRLW